MATRRKPTAERRDRQAFQARRLHAAELFAHHVHQAEVARTLGVSRQTMQPLAPALAGRRHRRPA